jgi:hypothetical protein
MNNYGIFEDLDAKDIIGQELTHFSQEILPDTRYIFMVYIHIDGSFGYINAGYSSELEKLALPRVIDEMLNDHDNGEKKGV